jgi:hypothetical protein
MKTEKQENLMNKGSNPQAGEMADLIVPEGQADEVKGSLNYTKIEFSYKPQKPDGS